LRECVQLLVGIVGGVAQW